MDNVGLGGGSVQLIVNLDAIQAPLAHHFDDGRARASAVRNPVLAGHFLELNDGTTVAFSAFLTG
jgi:hypothetical protein